MKISKSMVLGTAVALTLLPLSLSAKISPEDLEQKIRTARACPAPQVIVEAPAAEQGWFSSFRKAAGNALRSLGDSVRTEDEQTAAGRVKEAVKQGALSLISVKTGIPFDQAKEGLCVVVGNGLRTLGQFIKGGEATQTTPRIILDNLGLSKFSTDDQVQEALKTVATATFRADQSLAIEDYRLVAEGMVKRGYASSTQMKAIDINAIYLNALGEEELRKNSDLTASKFIEAVKVNGFTALENINPVKNAPIQQKLPLMDQFLKKAFDQMKLKQNLDNQRNRAIAAPAA